MSSVSVSKTYTATADPTQPGGGPVAIYLDGEFAGVLRHVVKHSPTGFGWGYGGSGPADLARSLLIDALATDAACHGCAGSGYQLWDTAADTFIPAAAADAAEPSYGGCLECRGTGYSALIEGNYQTFKEQVVATLGNQWTVTEGEIRQWLWSQPAPQPPGQNRQR